MPSQLPMSRIASSYGSVKKYLILHKFVVSALAIALIAGGYVLYRKTHATSSVHYVMTTVQKKTIISTVTGSGQVSPTNQIDIKSRVSGAVTSVPVHEGQYVNAGQAIAYIDARDALKALRDAQSNLASAKLSLQKLQEPADTLSLTQAQNNLAQAQDLKQTSEDSLTKSYDDGFTQISSTFLDLPTVLTGLNTILFSYDRALSGSQWNADFYMNTIAQYQDIVKAQQYRNDAVNGYNSAKAAYDKVSVDYKLANRSESAESTEKLLNDTNAMTLAVSSAVKNATNLIQLYQDVETAHNLTPASLSNTHLSSLNTYTVTSNGHVSGLSSALTSIKSAKQSIESATRSIAQSQASLDKTKAGTDPLDVQSAQLTIQQRANAVADAQNALSDYAVRAPFSGTLAKVAIRRADNASPGVTAATIITKQQIAELSVNEIDAAKIKAGQHAVLTFDAIDGLSLTGDVASVDALGTVSQGVVSYAVKIGFDTQDPRMKPGMTVNASIQMDARANVLSVPSSSIKSKGRSRYVQGFSTPIVNTDGSRIFTTTQAPQNFPVVVGISDDTDTEILSGLDVGQQIISKTVTGSALASTSGSGNRPAGGFRLP